ncbi:PDR/VanB family oxidoreductase [Streptomyces sp. NPDC096012]|uniref:PDR/VanB family oxidoreductase n=1 Tax=Streptomyces sp. NPDC096012 TaxID=3155684 RepID=UPI003369D441
MSDTGLTLQVSRLERVADEVLAVTLADPGGAELPPWKPGAHVEVTLGEYVRHYSLCGDPADRHTYRLGVLREPSGRGGSAYAHTRLRVGDRLPVGPPRNQFPLVKGERYVFVAGGVGITPLLAMIRQVHRDGLPWRLVYGGRRLSAMAFVDELEPYGDRVRLCPQDVYGHPDLAAAMDVGPGTRIYACGPEPLLAAVRKQGATLDGSTVHIERFAPRVDLSTAPATEFDVACVASERLLTVRADETMLDAMLRAGIDVNHDCRQGTCGTCELELLDGEALHLDSVLDPDDPERGSLIFPCVSRAAGRRLVVDI